MSNYQSKETDSTGNGGLAEVISIGTLEAGVIAVNRLLEKSRPLKIRCTYMLTPHDVTSHLVFVLTLKISPYKRGPILNSESESVRLMVTESSLRLLVEKYSKVTEKSPKRGRPNENAIHRFIALELLELMVQYFRSESSTEQIINREGLINSLAYSLERAQQ